MSFSCPICYDDGAWMVLDPCHHALCEVCFLHWQEQEEERFPKDNVFVGTADGPNRPLGDIEPLYQCPCCRHGVVSAGPQLEVKEFFQQKIKKSTSKEDSGPEYGAGGLNLVSTTNLSSANAPSCTCGKAAADSSAKKRSRRGRSKTPVGNRRPLLSSSCSEQDDKDKSCPVCSLTTQSSRGRESQTGTSSLAEHNYINIGATTDEEVRKKRIDVAIHKIRERTGRPYTMKMLHYRPVVAAGRRLTWKRVIGWILFTLLQYLFMIFLLGVAISLVCCVQLHFLIVDFVRYNGFFTLCPAMAICGSLLPGRREAWDCYGGPLTRVI